jgi:hypothetical protein
MQQETISALEVFEQGLTKSNIKQMAQDAVYSVLERGNPLQVAEALTAMENFIKEVKDTKEFKEYVREEAGKYGKVYTSPSGAKIELAETGTAYDFYNCGDIVVIILEQELEMAKMRLEERKKFLKNLPIEGIDQLNKETGDIERIYPPAKTSTSSYKVTLAR